MDVSPTSNSVITGPKRFQIVFTLVSERWMLCILSAPTTMEQPDWRSSVAGLRLGLRL